jgi:hypothetical protein
MRTTLDIDDPILREIKAIHENDGRSLGAIVSSLLAEALARHREPQTPVAFSWVAHPLRALADPADKDAIYAILDGNSR